MPYQTRKPELGRDELEGFENYVRYRYRHDLDEAEAILLHREFSFNTGLSGYANFVIAIFEKLATPRVFLIDEWRKLEDKERLAYYSKDYQDKARAEAEDASRKAHEALSQ